jgi:hypothetical protein
LFLVPLSRNLHANDKMSREAELWPPKQMEKRLQRREARRSVSQLWAATYILLGLRHSPATAHGLLQGDFAAMLQAVLGCLHEHLNGDIVVYLFDGLDRRERFGVAIAC